MNTKTSLVSRAIGFVRFLFRADSPSSMKHHRARSELKDHIDHAMDREAYAEALPSFAMLERYEGALDERMDHLFIVALHKGGNPPEARHRAALHLGRFGVECQNAERLYALVMEEDSAVSEDAFASVEASSSPSFLSEDLSYLPLALGSQVAYEVKCLGKSHEWYCGSLPTTDQILDRVQIWPAARAVSDFVKKFVNDRPAGVYCIPELLKELEERESKGNPKAKEALQRLENALANNPNPTRWVEILVNPKKIPLAEVDAIIKERNNARIRWNGQNDEIVQNPVVLPLTYWDLSNSGLEDGREIGQVCEEDENAMRERLLALQRVFKHGGVVATASPIVLRPDGRHSFFAMLCCIKNPSTDF